MKRVRSFFGSFIDKHPLFSFAVGLFLLLDVILIGNFIRKPNVAFDPVSVIPKNVELYHFGQVPRVGVSGVVDRSGIVNVVAQTSGVVHAIFVQEGGYVGVGQQVASISTTYSGGNIADLSREIADKSASNTNLNLQNQLEILSLQRRSAEKLAADSGVSGGSVGDLQRESSVRQTDSAATSLQLAANIADLNLAIASVSAQLGRPVSPISGRVDRVYVRQGQNVQPGMSIALVSNQRGRVTVRAFVSGSMAKRIDMKQKAKVRIDKHEMEVPIRSVANQPTDGSLYAVTMEMPASTLVDDQERIFVLLPLSSSVGTKGLFLPLDAVYQTQSGAYVFVLSEFEGKKVAKSTSVQLGEVVGSFVQVVDGLSASDSAILSRTVVDGDVVEGQ